MTCEHDIRYLVVNGIVDVSKDVIVVPTEMKPFDHRIGFSSEKVLVHSPHSTYLPWTI